MTSGHTQRVIALVDMDCFYCQVEARLNPALKGKPVAVVQYNQWKGGGIIAVNYEAKWKGVKRGMRGAEALELCPDIELVSVPVTRGKADLTKYREASEEVAKIFSDFSDLIQRASIDEAYIDLTKAVKERIKNGLKVVDSRQLKSTYIVGYSDLNANKEDERNAGVHQWINLMNECTEDSPDFNLTVGGVIIEEMREEILKKTGFHCSAGIAHNKVLAKLVAGLHKPKHQTILPHDNVPELYESLPVQMIRSLGGKFGKLVAERLSIKYMSELYRFSLQELQQKFDEKSGMWLYNIARGIDSEPVTTRLVPESIGCCKRFRGKDSLKTKEEVKHWLRELADELSERLLKDQEKNKRRAKILTISIHHETTTNKTENLHSYETDIIAKTAFDALKKFNNASPSSDAWEPPVQFLGLSAGKFSKEEASIGSFFKTRQETQAIAEDKPSTSEETLIKTEEESVSSSSSSSATREEEGSFLLSFIKKHLELSIKEDGRVKPEPVKIEKVEDDPPLSGPSTSNDYANETQLCGECNKQIKMLDFFEHLDYHAAVKLQAEINRELRANVKETPVQQQKRKRMGDGKQVPKKSRDIKSFFHVVTK